MAEVEPHCASDYDDRTKVAVKSVLVEIARSSELETVLGGNSALTLLHPRPSFCTGGSAPYAVSRHQCVTGGQQAGRCLLFYISVRDW